MTPVNAGSRINYHGSLAEHHGPGTVLEYDNFDHPTVTSEDGHRYIIRLDTDQYLYNVRRQSFTASDETVLVKSET